MACVKISRSFCFLVIFPVVSKVDDRFAIELFCLNTAQQIPIIHIVETIIQITTMAIITHWIKKARFPLTQSSPLQPNGTCATQHPRPAKLNDLTAAINTPPITAYTKGMACITRSIFNNRFDVS